jgi:outer membrane protein assembly factor BamB
MLTSCALSIGLLALAGDGNWPSFRGPNATGAAEGHMTPAEWNVEQGQNVRWRTPIPGLAHSSPVIWGDRVFVTTAVMEGEAVLAEVGSLKTASYGDVNHVPDEGVHQLQLICLDRKSGEVLWSKTSYEGALRYKRHPKSSHAASSPAVDAERVVAFFASEGLYAYDHDGELLWKRDLGEMNSGFFNMTDYEWGFASSPVLHEGRVILQCDVVADQFLAALDASNGEDVWRTAREDVCGWGSPTIDVREGRSQIVVNGYKHIGGYDLETGAELWKLVGGGDVPTPTPVVSDELVYITNAHGRMRPIYAVKLDATGAVAMQDEGSEHMAWSSPNRGNYMTTPIVVEGEIYFCSDGGVLACYDKTTGEEHYRERLSGRSGFSASPVTAGGLIYFTSEDGEVHVVIAGPDFDVLKVNDMGEVCMATPAISRGAIYWRTRGHLVAIAQE